MYETPNFSIFSYILILFKMTIHYHKFGDFDIKFFCVSQAIKKVGHFIMEEHKIRSSAVIKFYDS